MKGIRDLNWEEWKFVLQGWQKKTSAVLILGLCILTSIIPYLLPYYLKYEQSYLKQTIPKVFGIGVSILLLGVLTYISIPELRATPQFLWLTLNLEPHLFPRDETERQVLKPWAVRWLHSSGERYMNECIIQEKRQKSKECEGKNLQEFIDSFSATELAQIDAFRGRRGELEKQLVEVGERIKHSATIIKIEEGTFFRLWKLYNTLGMLPEVKTEDEKIAVPEEAPKEFLRGIKQGLLAKPPA